MLRSRLQNLSLQKKITYVYIVANVFILLANLVFLFGINSMSMELEQVYHGNRKLNELVEALDAVQDNMTEYLNSKTSDSLNEYYRSEQDYSALIEELSEKVGRESFSGMERNIKKMSEQYLQVTNQTIEAKRGRNVEKYRVRYEDATNRYDYISTYIQSLNMEQFISNSESYNQLSRIFRIFEYTSMTIMLVVIVGNVLFIVKFTENLISPLRDLAGLANEVAKGNFEIELPVVHSQDEIGVVSSAFSKMVINIREYIEQIRESMENERKLKEKELLMEAHLKDAQLKYLLAQINPHFLFNTLNAGAQLAMMEGADRTYEYVQKVANFFRYNVKKGNDIVTIRDEIELVDDYIYILNVRFSGDIHYNKAVDEELLEIKMPGMILQPIVENCVNHGIREMAGKGKIWFSIYEEDGLACISIRDNGIGMSQETIEKVLSGTYRDEQLSGDSNGIGMDNVLARLRLYNGFDKVCDIISEGRNQGTEIIIYLKQTRQEEICIR